MINIPQKKLILKCSKNNCFAIWLSIKKWVASRVVNQVTAFPIVYHYDSTELLFFLLIELLFQVTIYDLSSETIDENDVLIMATDGLWERVSNERVC